MGTSPFFSLLQAYKNNVRIPSYADLSPSVIHHSHFVQQKEQLRRDILWLPPRVMDRYSIQVQAFNTNDAYRTLDFIPFDNMET